MRDAGVDFKKDTGKIVFADDGTTPKETVSSLYIAHENNAGDALQDLNSQNNCCNIM